VLVLIQCYLDCECDVQTMVVIAGHLDRCPRCAAEVQQLRWIKAAVRRCGATASESELWL
jgi:anti-sigma factor RsiW